MSAGGPAQRGGDGLAPGGGAGASTGGAGDPVAGRTTLILVRHGVTAWNRERRFQGQLDTPLSEDGRQQARRLAARLAAAPRTITAIYTSDLQRARDTARPVAEALDLPLVIDTGLRERGYGAFEGRTFEEIEHDLADAWRRWREREPDFELPGGGESLSRFHLRVQQTLDRLVGRHSGTTVLAVTHGGVLDSAYRIASGLAMEAVRRHDLHNASLNTIALDAGAYRLIEWGDIAHLDDAVDDATAGPRR